MKKLDLKDIKTVGIIRASALGDLVFCLPLLQTLRKALPKAKITLIGAEWQEHYIPKHVLSIDSIITLPDDMITPSKRFTQKLQHYAMSLLLTKNFDLLLQIHDGSTTANNFARRIMAKNRIGFSEDKTKLPGFRAVLPFDHKHHEVLRLLEIPKLLGIRDFQLQPEITVTEREQIDVLHVLQRRDSKQPIAIVHPGAADERRRWPAEKFAKVCDWLSNKGYYVVITGSREEWMLGNNVAGNTKGDIENICGILSLPHFMALLSSAALVVSNDSGPLHAARSFDVPTVGLYTAQCYPHSAPLFTVLDRSIVSHMKVCPLCKGDILLNHWPKDTKAACQHKTSLLADIDVDQVTKAISSLGLKKP